MFTVIVLRLGVDGSVTDISWCRWVRSRLVLDGTV